MCFKNIQFRFKSCISKGFHHSTRAASPVTQTLQSVRIHVRSQRRLPGYTMSASSHAASTQPTGLNILQTDSDDDASQMLIIFFFFLFWHTEAPFFSYGAMTTALACVLSVKRVGYRVELALKSSAIYSGAVTEWVPIDYFHRSRVRGELSPSPASCQLLLAEMSVHYRRDESTGDSAIKALTIRTI